MDNKDDNYIYNLIINGCNCFNCINSHLFDDKLICTKYNKQVEDDDAVECWKEERE